MKHTIKILLLLASALGLVGAASAQTILSTTTLGAAITSTSTNQTGQTVTLASTSTMLSSGQTNQFNTLLYVDQELMGVISVVDSTHVTVRRAMGTGLGGKPTTHINGATVWFGNSANGNVATSYFTTNSGPENWAACTATSQISLPRINVYWGTKADCLGVAPAGHWVRTDAPGYPVLGAVYTVPAGVIVPGGTIFLTDTGTAAATGIQVPNGWSPGMIITIVPGGAFTWTTATNLRTSGTAAANHPIQFIWDGAKWDVAQPQ